MAKNKKELTGYYYDGKKSYKLYKDENGKETQVLWKDEESNYDYSGIDHDNGLCNKQKGRK